MRVSGVDIFKRVQMAMCLVFVLPVVWLTAWSIHLHQLRREVAVNVRLLVGLSGAERDPASSEPAPASPDDDSRLVAQLESAHGMLTPQLALFQTMPMAKAVAVVEALKRRGYRPLRFRPFAIGKGTQVAAVWTKDDREWTMSVNEPLESILQEQEDQERDGWVPVDLAGYTTYDGTEASVRYVAVWTKASASEPEKYVLKPGIASAALADQLSKLQREDLFPSTMQQFVDPDGELRVSVIADNRPGLSYWERDLTRTEYERLLTPSRLQVDVAIHDTPRSAPDHQRWHAVLDRVGEIGEKAPKDLIDRFERGRARLKLGQYDRAVEELSPLIDANWTRQGPRRLSCWSFYAYRLRAEAYARKGDQAKARGDLAEYCKYEVSGSSKTLLAAMVGAHFGDESALVDLESIVNAPDCEAEVLREAARVYAIAYRGARGRDARLAGVYAEKALAALRRCVSGGEGDLRTFRDDADLDSLRDRPEFQSWLHEIGFTPQYCYVSRSDPAYLSTELHRAEPAEHLAQCRRLASAGYVPSAIAVCCVGEDASLAAASVWRRSVISESDKDQAATRQANAAAALLRLGYADEVWPLLRHQADPRLRSFLLERLRPLNVPPHLLATRLNLEKDVSIRRALLLGLGEFKLEQLPADSRSALLDQLAALYRDDPDPGVHSAVEWLLGQWNRSERLVEPDESALAENAERRDWYVDKHGHGMIIIRGPVEFDMGSLPQDIERDHDELWHRRRIPRSFAIAAKPTTVAQYRKFDRACDYSRAKSPSADCPVNSVSWFEAAKYCRWLSEQEGVPDHEMCYPPAELIGPGMPLPDDYLSRTGYRLPTEAEFEFACRAGAVTPRFYGNAKELLPRYARYSSNSQGQTWPSGTLRPNDLGLFDVLGNLRQWCDDWYLAYTIPPVGGYREDLGQSGTATLKVYRSSDYDTLPVFLRSGDRLSGSPQNGYATNGFRVARTWVGYADANARTAVETRNSDGSQQSADRARALETAGQWQEVDAQYAAALQRAQDEDRPDLWSRRARIAAQEGRWEDEIEHYSDAIRVDGRNWSYYRGRAAAYAKRKQWSKAVQDLTEGLRLSPGNETLLVRRLKALVALEQWDRCLLDADLLSALGDHLGYALAARGIVRFSVGDRLAALDHLTKAIELNPNETWMRSWRGHVYLASGESREAFWEYDKVREIDAEIDASDASAHRALGQACYELDRFDPAVRYYDRALELDPVDALALAGRGLAKAKLKQQESGLADLNQAVAGAPPLADCLRSRARYFCDSDRRSDAIADLSRAIELDPTDPRLWHDRGECHYDAGDFEPAIVDFSQAIQVAPCDPEYWRDRGWACTKSKRYEEALSDFSQAVSLAPEDSRKWNERGDAYVQLGNRADAIGDYSKGISLTEAQHRDEEPLGADDAYHWNDRGDAYAADKQWDNALEDYSRAIALDPQDAAHWYDRAKVYQELKLPEEALEDYSTAIELAPDNGVYLARRASLLVEQDEQDKALEDLTKATEREPKIALFWEVKALVNCALGNDADAKADFSRAIDCDGANWKYRRYRGDLRAKTGNLDGAATDYEDAIGLGCDDPQYWMEYALLQHRIGGIDAYRRTYGRMLSKFAGTSDPETARQLLRGYVLFPRMTVEQDTLASLEEVVSKHEDEPVYLATVGALRYRQRRLDQAANSLKEGVEKKRADGDGDVDGLWAFVFLMMVYRDLERIEEVRATFSQLEKSIEREKDWASRIELSILRDELSASLQPSTGSER